MKYKQLRDVFLAFFSFSDGSYVKTITPTTTLPFKETVVLFLDLGVPENSVGRPKESYVCVKPLKNVRDSAQLDRNLDPPRNAKEEQIIVKMKAVDIETRETEHLVTLWHSIHSIRIHRAQELGESNHT